MTETRREATFIPPIPRPKKHKRATDRASLVCNERVAVSTAQSQSDPTPIIELTEVYQVDTGFKVKVNREFDAMMVGTGV